MPKSSELSFHQFMLRMKVGRAKLGAAVEKLGIELPVGEVGYNEAPMLSVAIQRKLSREMQLIPPEKVPGLRKKGHMTAMEMMTKLELTKPTIFRHLNAICPDWQESYPKIQQGQRRVVLLPPELVEQVRRYHEISYERQMFSIWKSMRTRNALDLSSNEAFGEFIQQNLELLKQIFVRQNIDEMKRYVREGNSLPAAASEQLQKMRRDITWSTMAQTLLESNDLVAIDDADKQMFQRMISIGDQSLMYMALYYLPVAIDVVTQIAPEGAPAHSAFIIEGFSFLSKQLIEISAREIPYDEFQTALVSAVTKYIRSFGIKGTIPAPPQFSK